MVSAHHSGPPERHPSPAKLAPLDTQHLLFESGRPAVSKTRQNTLKPAERQALRKEILDRPFTPEQRAMVEHVHGPLLALAGPGSGKTHAATNQALHLVSEGVRPGRILALTFTRKAAEEFKDRCRKTLRFYTKGLPSVSTMHSLGFSILKEHGDILGFRNGVRIISSIYADQFLQRGIDGLDVDVRATIDGDKMKAVREAISQMKNAGIDPIEARDNLKHPFASAYIIYQSWLQQTGFVDFDDLIRLPSALFTRTGQAGVDALKSWQRRFDFVIVDEYQDTNQAQEDLLVLMAQKHRNISVVGDDDQAIYGWRGAEVENIRQFGKRWAGTKIIRLETNFRSTPEILEPQNKLILKSKEERHQKILKANKKSGPEPVVMAFSDEFEEAKWVAESIRARIEEGKGSAGDCAIILRDQFRAKAERFEEALVNAKVPYASFFNDDLEMGPTKRNAYSLLGAIHDPKNEEPAFLQLFSSHTFQLEDQDYQNLLRLRRDGNRTIWDIMQAGEVKMLADGSKEKVMGLHALVKDLHARVRKPRRSEPLAHIARAAFAQLYPVATSDELWADSHTRNDTTVALRTIVKKLAAYEDSASTRHKTLASYLQFQLVEIPRRIQEGQTKKKANEDRAYVTLITMHGSKGLEFPYVYLPAFLEGVIPHEKSIPPDDGYDDDLPLFPRHVGAREDHFAKAEEEERRLAFVAGTRAKEGLYYSFAAQMGRRGRPEMSKPSRYLYDMELMHRLDTSNV